jgi:phosphate transport system substrate-binding protein
MKFHQSGVSSTTAGLAVVLIIVIIAAGAYVALGLGGTTTKTVTSTQTNTQTTTSTATTTAYTPPAGAISLSAGGSTFVNPVMQVWASAYHNTTKTGSSPTTINYQAIGSGAGQQGIFTNTLVFAGSDAPVSAGQLAPYASNGPLLQIPEALGGVAIFYNIPGITNSLNFNGPVLAGIYNGSITTWNDPRIQALNTGVTLPNNAIAPVHRSDGSGTTYALTSYLTTQSPSWKSTIGVGTSVNWPTSELAGKGSSGVAGTVTNNPNSIGYADSYYAFNNHLLAANIENQAGNFIQPSVAAFSAAAAAFATQLSTNATAPIVNTPASASTAYPISTFTYLLVWKNQTNEVNAWAIANFFEWVVTYGQTYSQPLYYAPIPPSIVTIDQQLISQLNFNGQTFTNP